MDRTPADRPDHPHAAQRFNEEAATYAVRGSDTPDLEAGVAAIRNVLKSIACRMRAVTCSMSARREA